MLTVGQVAENTYIFRRDESDTALIIDPGDEAERILATLEQLGISKIEAILLTHTHFDHIGAVAPVAKATGAPVYCPELETRSPRGHQCLHPVGGIRAVSRAGTPRRRSPAASIWSSPASRSTSSSRQATARGT